jgi:hypothetical protein
MIPGVHRCYGLKCARQLLCLRVRRKFFNLCLDASRTSSQLKKEKKHGWEQEIRSGNDPSVTRVREYSRKAWFSQNL